MKTPLKMRSYVSLFAKPILLSQLLAAPLHLGRALVPLGTASSTKSQRLSPPTFPTATSSQVLKTSQVAQWKLPRRTLATLSGVFNLHQTGVLDCTNNYIQTGRVCTARKPLTSGGSTSEYLPFFVFEQ